LDEIICYLKNLNSTSAKS